MKVELDIQERPKDIGIKKELSFIDNTFLEEENQKIKEELKN